MPKTLDLTVVPPGDLDLWRREDLTAAVAQLVVDKRDSLARDAMTYASDGQSHKAASAAGAVLALDGVLRYFDEAVSFYLTPDEADPKVTGE